MEVVRKAADAVRNSPLFRRRFGHGERREDRTLHPDRDLTPFVQGIYYKAQYIGKQMVPSERAQDHGCCDEAVKLLWSIPSPNAQDVSIKVTTRSLRIKSQFTKIVIQDLPVFHMSYCGTDNEHPEVFTFVAKEVDSGHFYCYVFRCTHAEKANALALSLAKAFYLAYQILLSEQGHFHEVPPRDSVFEPQTEEDTRMPPSRPDIAAILTQAERDSELRRNGDAGGLGAMEQVDVPRVARASESESLSSHISSESLDDDFVRLAKARSNPDILRSTLQAHEIASVSFDALRVHADPSSVNPSPATSPASLRKP